jgi:hypothetical protein
MLSVSSMARPLRIEFPGALYHLTSRGNESRPIFLDNKDTKKGTDLFFIEALRLKNRPPQMISG